MKTKMSPLLIVLLIASMWMIPCEPQALVIIPNDSRSGIMIAETAMDDPSDTDQGFQTSDRDVIVQINNGYRRYLGVVIDQTIQGQAAGPVDNGPNDRFVGLGSKLISADTLTTWSICARDWNSPLCTFYTPSSRNYILPVPSDAVPGSEVKFRLRIVGPAMLSAGPDSDIDKDLILETFGYSLWEVVARDLVKLCLGGQYPNPTYTVAFIKELMTQLKYVPAFWSALDKGDYGGMYDALVNWLLRSEVLKQYAADQALTGSTDLMEVLNLISGTLKVVTIAEMTNAMTQWGRANWQETYEVVVVIPKIGDIQPDSGKVNDVVTIHGTGFDPYNPSNNKVFFTGLNPDGFPVWMKEPATVIGVSGSGTLTVQVPAGFETGPVMVCTGMYCSNTDVSFSNQLPTGLDIISPTNGASVSGSISVVAVVPGAPSPFPASVGRLLVDGGEVSRKAVTTPDFSFVLDTGALAAGAHALTVELITGTQTLSKSVQIIAAGLPVTLTITSPAAGSTIFGTVPVSASIQNPPSPFPTSQAILLLDEQQKDQKSVTSADFSFTLDASALAVGNHALKVKLIMSGVEYTASINVTTSWYPSQGYGVNTGCYPGSGMSWAWYVPRKYGYKIYITFTPLNPACQIKAQVYATSPWGCGAGACNPFPIVNAVGAGPGAPVTMEYDLGKAFSCCPWGWYNDYFNAYIKYESMNSACYSGPFVKAEMAAPPAMGSLFAGSPYPCGGW